VSSGDLPDRGYSPQPKDTPYDPAKEPLIFLVWTGDAKDSPIQHHPKAISDRKPLAQFNTVQSCAGVRSSLPKPDQVKWSEQTTSNKIKIKRGHSPNCQRSKLHSFIFWPNGKAQSDKNRKNKKSQFATARSPCVTETREL